ncbi:DUF808 domain-containing protein [uncultured Sphingomonas sp.]|uniref:DUF808 domain-containing protein n=1 Tax=uncultured Sphingomonas sp. TaxID=158754 RepID=UPI0025F33219|nr:DUF808 domain-containing protein [uncultured Sphingomonas sp.]
MASGLIALLDDVAGIAKLAAASIDDVGLAAQKAATKAVGVVVDDTAVTPRYVTGLSPERELPIILKIALGSLRNKLLILLPAALLLSAFLPWAITPLLMLGGAFLCFEGAEKVLEALGSGHDGHADAAAIPVDPAQLEATQVSGAIRTDLILSAEIMAITLAQVAASPILTQAIVLALVGVAITVGVYGVVGVIVKLDDIGLHLARRRPAAVRALGRGLVKTMPILSQVLATVGTAAMLWVGGGILLHGLEGFGVAEPAGTIHHVAHAAGAHAGPLAGTITWLATAVASGVIGLAVGALVAMVVGRLFHRAH